MARCELQSLTLIPDMIARGHHIRTGIDGFQMDILGNAKSAGGVFAIDHDEVQFEIGNQARQLLPDRSSARPAHHVTQKQKTHAAYLS